MTQALIPAGGAVEAGAIPFWTVRVYGFDGSPYDPVVEARSSSAARYAVFKAAREAGYFSGRDGFRRFLSNSQVRPAAVDEIRFAPRIGGHEAAPTPMPVGRPSAARALPLTSLEDRT